MRSQSIAIRHHYRYLFDTLTQDFLRLSIVEKVPIWQASDDPDSPRIYLQTANQYDFESELTLFLMVGSEMVSFMGCVIVPGNLVGSEAETVLLVTRVQGVSRKGNLLKAVTKLSGDCTPRLVLLAAMKGIARALEIPDLAGIGAENQSASAYMAQVTPAFVESYDGFWQSLFDQNSDQAYYHFGNQIHFKPLSAVSAHHRGRAQERRSYRSQVSRFVESQIDQYRKQPRIEVRQQQPIPT